MTAAALVGNIQVSGQRPPGIQCPGPRARTPLSLPPGRLLESAELVSPLGHFARASSKSSSGLE